MDEKDPTATERLQTLEQERAQMEVLRVKMEHLDFRNDEHKTPLHLAAMSGNMAWVEVLEQGTAIAIAIYSSVYHYTISYHSFNGWASLSSHSYGSVVRFLVRKYPPSLTHVENDRNTPLHLALRHGRTDVAGFLIRKRAEVDARWEALWVA